MTVYKLNGTVRGYITSEALPQTDELGETTRHCLRPSDAGCSILDKTKNESFLITSSIQEPASSICSQVTLQHIET